MIACCQRGSAAKLTARVLSHRGLSDAWRTCSVSADDHNVRVRLRMRECKSVLTQAGGAVDPATVCGDMAKLDPSKATGTSLDGTDANGQRPPQRCTTSEQWQRDVITNLTSVPRNPR